MVFLFSFVYFIIMSRENRMRIQIHTIIQSIEGEWGFYNEKFSL